MTIGSNLSAYQRSTELYQWRKRVETTLYVNFDAITLCYSSLSLSRGLGLFCVDFRRHPTKSESSDSRGFEIAKVFDSVPHSSLSLLPPHSSPILSPLLALTASLALKISLATSLVDSVDVLLATVTRRKERRIRSSLVGSFNRSKRNSRSQEIE